MCCFFKKVFRPTAVISKLSGDAASASQYEVPAPPSLSPSIGNGRSLACRRYVTCHCLTPFH